MSTLKENSAATINLPLLASERRGWPWEATQSSQSTMISDQQTWPRISIVTPSYNQGQFIEETIRSVLGQNYPNLEYIIIDGGSTDQTVEIIRRYETFLAYWQSEPDGGQAAAINYGFTKATGEILTWLNSDDLLCSGALYAVAQAWLQKTPCHFLTGYGYYVSADRSQLLTIMQAGNYSFFKLLQFCRGNFLPQPAVFFSRTAFQEVNGLDEKLFYTMDLDLWLRLRLKYPLYYAPICLAQLRAHAQAKTWHQNQIAVIEEVNQVVGRYMGKVTMLEQLYLQHDMRLWQAKITCSHGLAAYFANHCGEAFCSIQKAICLHPGVILTFNGLQLLSRLLLPQTLKLVLFRQP